MTKPKWYSPQISREIVSRLYFKAKADGIPMTRLASRLIEEALGSEETIAMVKTDESNIDSKSK